MATEFEFSPSESEFFGLYRALRAHARALMRREPNGHTLQPTALVHEAWERVTRARPALAARPREFFVYAARTMRSILVDHARRRQRRTKHAEPCDDLEFVLDGLLANVAHRSLDLLALHDAIERLQQHDPEMAAFVDLRYFAGLDVGSISEMLGVPRRTLERHWRVTRAWLEARLS